MADTDAVRLTFHEAEDVKRMISEYRRACGHYDSGLYAVSLFHPQVEDLVNCIGEVYETALARAIRESVRSVHEGMSAGR